MRAADKRLATAADYADPTTELVVPSLDLETIVSGLRQSREVTHRIRYKGTIRRLPSRDVLIGILDDLSAALFPAHYGQSQLSADNIDYFVGNKLAGALHLLLEQVHRDLSVIGDPSEDLSARALSITRKFAADLPLIRGILVSDLRAAYQGDPAATSFPEILLGYPGMTAIIYHRLAHVLHQGGAKLVARLVAEIAHSKTGIDIHPAATVGPSFFIDHGTGVVIGETTIIGERVRLYQAVTLGALNFPADATGTLIKGNARHPIIEDDVTIYAGATILGRITIGRGSTIGGNVWLTDSVPANSRVTQAHTRTSRRAESLGHE